MRDNGAMIVSASSRTRECSYKIIIENAMATRYYIRLPEPAKARGSDSDLAFKSEGAEGFSGELETALRTTALFDRWKAKQAEPDEIDQSLAAIDVNSTVTATHHDLYIDLVVVTSVPGPVFKQRLRLLAGSNWQLSDVKAA